MKRLRRSAMTTTTYKFFVELSQNVSRTGVAPNISRLRSLIESKLRRDLGSAVTTTFFNVDSNAGTMRFSISFDGDRWEIDPSEIIQMVKNCAQAGVNCTQE